MVLKQNLIHHAALEYHGKKKGNDFVTVGKNFQYKISKLFSDVCFDLLLWQLPNLDIAFKQIKIVKMPKNYLACCFFCLYHIYSQGTNVLCTVVYICLQSCTSMVSCQLPFMTDMTCLHNSVFISVAIALNGCIIYVQDLIYNMNPTVMFVW
jgi:hypothetical protein